MAYIPRLSKYATTDLPAIWDVSFYTNNPFTQTSASYGMPNCTCYAYGRYAEIRGAFAKLPTGNAGTWYNRATAFQRGSEPKLGAVICWYDPKGSRAGHVAIVEQILDNGDLITSNSGYTTNKSRDSSQYFWTETVRKSDGYRSNWEINYGYQLQGFIYNDYDDSSDSPEIMPKANWSAKARDGYTRTSNEAQGNAVGIYNILNSYGWTVNAICGLLGNLEQECGYNFWQWENGPLSSDSDKQYSTTNNAYGFVQWTPASGYTKDTDCMAREGFGPNYTDKPGKLTDAEVQLWAIHNKTKSSGQWINNNSHYNRTFPETFDEFISSKSSAEYLANCWMVNYERPSYYSSVNRLSRRQEAAKYWWDFFNKYEPESPEEPGDTGNPEPDIPTNPPVITPTEPIVTPTNNVTGVTIKPKSKQTFNSEWCVKNWGIWCETDNEAIQNACCIYNMLIPDLQPKPWTLRAVCAVLGNIGVESGYNPHYWSGDSVQASFIIAGDALSGYWEVDNPLLDSLLYPKYGLFQFNPINNYNKGDFINDDLRGVNFCNPIWHVELDIVWKKIITGYVWMGKPTDGQAQMQWLIDDCFPYFLYSSGLNGNGTVIPYGRHYYTEPTKGEVTVKPRKLSRNNDWTISQKFRQTFDVFRYDKIQLEILTEMFAFNALHYSSLSKDDLAERIRVAKYWWNYFNKRKQEHMIIGKHYNVKF